MTSANPTNLPMPPRGSFSVWQRLLRGYGPLAVLAVLLLLMSVFVPSKVPADQELSTEGASSSNSSNGFDSGTSDDGSGSGDPVDVGGSSSDGGSSSGNDAAAGGDGNGGGGGDGVPPGGTAGACSDRQLQVPGDPYSPPCIGFSGNNGGATHKGVTGDSIKVSYRSLNEQGFQQTLAALADASLVDTPETVENTVRAMAEYFNTNFQFYGREIDIQFYDGKGSNTTELLGGGRDKAVADAITVAEQIGAFADLSATSEPYADALADRGVIGFGTPYLSRQWHEQRAPFAWSLAVDGTRVSELAAEYNVKKLQGGNAELAGGDLRGKPRKFATIAPENSWYQESVDNARRIVEEGGGDPGLNVEYVLNLGTMSNQAANIVPKLKSQGITTIVCGCDPVLPVFLTSVFDRERYYPEFIIAGTALTDFDLVGQLWDPEYMATGQAFGVSPLEPFQPPTSTIAYQAFKQVRPSEEPAFTVELIYYQMYMLAIGIQGAGPDLNPSTFEQGMFNYPARSGPFGLWKFGPGDRTGANDVREIYWDEKAISPYNKEPGSYVGTDGKRYEFGQQPEGKPQVPA